MAAGLAHHPFSNRQNKASFLCQRNELGRADKTLLRMLPADERFEALQPLFRKTVKRLEMQRELPVADRGPEVQFHLAAPAGLFVERRFEEVVIGLAVAFRAVERQVGVLHQRVAVRAVAGSDCDAEAGRTVGLMPIEGDRANETSLNASGKVSEVLLRSDIVDENGEFVAAEPRDKRLGQALPQMVGDIAQQRIACGVAERIVHDLEIVEIDIDHHQPFITAAPPNGARKLLHEQLPVRQVGEAVMEADMRNPPLALFDRVDHRVEAARQTADLVIGFDSDVGIASVADPARGFIEFLQRLRYGARDAKTQAHDQQQRENAQPADQPVEAVVLFKRSRQRMAQHQPRLQSGFHDGKLGNAVEYPVRIFALENQPKRMRIEIGRKIAAAYYVGIEFDCSKRPEPVHFAAIQRLGQHEPPDEIGNLDRRRGRKSQLVAEFDNAVVFAAIERIP